MFKKKDKNGVVGADKNADRQIIVWITNAILQAIQENKSIEKLGTLTLSSNPDAVWGYSMKDAQKVWGTVTPSDICEKFKKAYNSKLFSKSKQYVLPYFDAVENILTEKNKDQLPALLEDLSKSCNQILKREISNKKALFSASEIQSTGTSTFKTAMDALIKEYETIQTQKQIEEGRRECKQRFEILAQGLLDDLERYYSWEVFDGLDERLKDLVECFENAYLSGGTLTVTHPEYTLKPEKGSYLLTAYPVLHALSKKATTDNINDAVIEKIRKFMDAAYNKLEDEALLPNMPTDEEGNHFDIDIAEVMFALLDK